MSGHRENVRADRYLICIDRVYRDRTKCSKRADSNEITFFLNVNFKLVECSSSRGTQAEVR